MIPLETWLLFCLACAALSATPGPNMLFLVSRTLVQGRRAGFVSLAGTSTGFAIHAIAAALGLSALLAAVPVAYEIVRFAGAIYLAWLALVTWRASGATAAGAPARRAEAGQMYRQGLLTSVLNPKLAVFQLALFPQFIQPNAGSMASQMLVLASILNIIGFAVNGAVILLGSQIRNRLRAMRRLPRLPQYALAAVFTGLACRLALQSRN